MGDFFDVGPLEGRLVRLEPLDTRHITGLVEAAQEGRDRYALTDVPADEAGMRWYVETAAAERDTNTTVSFATIDRRTQRVAGSTRFCYFDYWRWQEEHRRRPAEVPDAVEIGYTWLARNAQRTGINREAKLLMLQVAFERWRMLRVRFGTDARNERSRAAISGLGARLDGVLRSAAAGYDGAIRDTAVYSILDSEWPGIRDALKASLQP
jgi:RimJ/RimL family protein N-acetyltransferase